jgi:hypothetical protein
MIQANILKDCWEGNHDLKAIYRVGDDNHEEVVRWCSVCGAVVVDGEVDHRVKPGAIMRMVAPEFSSEKFWAGEEKDGQN